MLWTLKQTPDMPAGTAELRSDRSDIDPGSVELCISEQQPGGGLRHLDPRDSGQPWGTQEFWQRPVAAEREGTGLRLRLDEFTTFHLGANKPYILSLRDAAGPRDRTRFLGIGLRLPSEPPKGWRPAAEPAPAPAAVAVAVEEPAPEAEPPREAPADPPIEPAVDPVERPRKAQRRGLLLPVLAALLLLAAAGTAGWWYLQQSDTEVAKPEPPAPAPEPEPEPEAERTLAAARSTLAAAPPAAEARAAGEAHLAAQDLEGGFLLLRYAAENGDVPAALAVGGLYDPASWSAETSPLPAPNADQAANWYRRAAEAGDAEAQYRLALVLRSGRTETPDGPEQAVAWLRKAADQGHAKAKEALGQ